MKASCNHWGNLMQTEDFFLFQNFLWKKGERGLHNKNVHGRRQCAAHTGTKNDPLFTHWCALSSLTMRANCVPFLLKTMSVVWRKCSAWYTPKIIHPQQTHPFSSSTHGSLKAHFHAARTSGISTQKSTYA